MKPVLYSFRRCPYAMRARLALAASGKAVELREVVLRDKPQSMLDASPKGTVPVMVMPDGRVIEESIDIIKWSLSNAASGSEAADWVLEKNAGDLPIADLISENDGPFKAALDAYKYPNRFPEKDPEEAREAGSIFIRKLGGLLGKSAFLGGEKFSVADAAILPFVRQFAHVDQQWFYDETWENVIRWLDAFKNGQRFASIMAKYQKWEPGAEPVIFGAAEA